MAKFIFTETQLDTIKKSIKENRFTTGKDDRYRIECEVEIDNYGLTFKGKEIDDITTSKITMVYDIDMEARSYGIKYIMPYNPQGESEIELEVIYYEDEDTQIEETITIPLNWDDAQTEDTDSIGYIGFDSLITIRLKNDEQGGLTSDFITVYKKSI
jgi:hypothetical protein